MIAQFAVISGLLQALGYGIYIKKSLSKESDPNPATWLMFAYGTLTLTLLEWDHQAPWELLLLPIVCSTLSLWVVYICKQRGTLAWPTERVARGAFVTDVLLTVGYVAVKITSCADGISEAQRDALVFTFIVLSNLSTFVSFLPLLESTRKEPDGEHPLPWFVWTAAYTTLGFVTYFEQGKTINVFLMYPVSCALLHGLAGLLAMRAFLPKPFGIRAPG